MGGELHIIRHDRHVTLAQLHNGVPPRDDVQRVALVQLGSAVALARRHLGEREHHVQLCQGARRAEDALGVLRGDLGP